MPKSALFIPVVSAVGPIIVAILPIGLLERIHIFWQQIFLYVILVGIIHLLHGLMHEADKPTDADNNYGNPDKDARSQKGRILNPSRQRRNRHRFPHMVPSIKPRNNRTTATPPITS